MGRNFVLLGLSLNLYPVIQIDTTITQCCNFSKDFLVLETERDVHLSIIGIKMVVNAKTGWTSAECCSV